MEHEGRERGGEIHWKMMLCVQISHYFPQDFVVSGFMLWKSLAVLRLVPERPRTA